MHTEAGQENKAGRRGRRAALLLAWLTLLGCAQPAEEGDSRATKPAELILQNGIVLTVDADNSQHQAIAVDQGLIQALGSNAAMQSRVGPNTEIIDLKGLPLNFVQFELSCVENFMHFHKTRKRGQ